MFSLGNKNTIRNNDIETKSSLNLLLIKTPKNLYSTLILFQVYLLVTSKKTFCPAKKPGFRFSKIFCDPCSSTRMPIISTTKCNLLRRILCRKYLLSFLYRHSKRKVKQATRSNYRQKSRQFVHHIRNLELLIPYLHLLHNNWAFLKC